MRRYIVNQSTDDYKNITQQGVRQISMRNTSWVIEVFLNPLNEYKIFNEFLSKNKFLQSPERTKKYSSKYNDYRLVINIAQNFGSDQNKNFNLYTRQI